MWNYYSISSFSVNYLLFYKNPSSEKQKCRRWRERLQQQTGFAALSHRQPTYMSRNRRYQARRYGDDHFRSSPRTHSLTEPLLGFSERRFPSSQSPVPAIFSRFVPLLPIPELADVQNRTTFFPVKLLLLMKLFTIHGASPHRIG